MKKVPLFILTCVLCAGFFATKRAFSAITFRAAGNTLVHTSFHVAHSSSVLRSPLSLVFPYESFSPAVCRRPLSLFWLDNNFDDYYFHRAELTVPSNPATFTRIGQDMLFRKGNSYLLIPQTLTLRLSNDFQPANPTLHLRKPD